MCGWECFLQLLNTSAFAVQFLIASPNTCLPLDNPLLWPAAGATRAVWLGLYFSEAVFLFFSLVSCSDHGVQKLMREVVGFWFVAFVGLCAILRRIEVDDSYAPKFSRRDSVSHDVALGGFEIGEPERAAVRTFPRQRAIFLLALLAALSCLWRAHSRLQALRNRKPPAALPRRESNVTAATHSWNVQLPFSVGLAWFHFLTATNVVTFLGLYEANLTTRFAAELLVLAVLGVCAFHFATERHRDPAYLLTLFGTLLAVATRLAMPESKMPPWATRFIVDVTRLVVDWLALWTGVLFVIALCTSLLAYAEPEVRYTQDARRSAVDSCDSRGRRWSPAGSERSSEVHSRGRESDLPPWLTQPLVGNENRPVGDDRRARVGLRTGSLDEETGGRGSAEFYLPLREPHKA